MTAQDTKTIFVTTDINPEVMIWRICREVGLGHIGRANDVAEIMESERRHPSMNISNSSPSERDQAALDGNAADKVHRYEVRRGEIVNILWTRPDAVVFLILDRNISDEWQRIEIPERTSASEEHIRTVYKSRIMQ